MNQCHACQHNGPQCHCDRCDGQRDPNELCPWCQRTCLIWVGAELACDRCSYRKSHARHLEELARIAERQKSRELTEEQKADARKLKEIRGCYYLTTKRRAPGGNDAVGTAKEDKLKTTSLIRIAIEDRAESGIVSSETRALRQADACRVQVPGKRPPGLTNEKLRDLLDAECAAWMREQQSWENQVRAYNASLENWTMGDLG